MRRGYRRHLGSHFSEGARLAWARLPKHKVKSLADLARRLGVDKSVVSRWMYGDSKPKLEGMLAFERELGISPKVWLKPPAKEFAFPTRFEAAA